MVTEALRRHAAEKRDMEPHVDTLADLAGEALVVVEFGVRTGVSTWAILEGLPTGGRLVSVDIDRDDTSMVPKRVLEDERLNLLVGDDRNTDTQARLPASADLVFIDTSHEYHHTVEELDLARRLDAKVIALHDYALTDVADAVHGFVRRHDNWSLEVEWSEWAMAILRRA